MPWTKEARLAWAAGFFDGEGYCGVTGRSIRIIVVQTGDEAEPPDTLVRFREFVGHGRIARRQRVAKYPHWSPTWVLSVTSANEVKAVAALLLPYLCQAKREQIEAALLARHDYEVDKVERHRLCRNGHAISRFGGRRRCRECHRLAVNRNRKRRYHADSEFRDTFLAKNRARQAMKGDHDIAVG